MGKLAHKAVQNLLKRFQPQAKVDIHVGDLTSSRDLDARETHDAGSHA
jgi:hypothetical protein